MATAATELSNADLNHHVQDSAPPPPFYDHASSAKPTTALVSEPPESGDVDLLEQTSQEGAIQAIIERMKVSGACIVRNMVHKDAMDEVEKEIKPHLDTASVWEGLLLPFSSWMSLIVPPSHSLTADLSPTR